MISADWSRSGFNEKEQDYGATTVFYPTDGSSPNALFLCLLGACMLCGFIIFRSLREEIAVLLHISRKGIKRSPVSYTHLPQVLSHK